MSDKRVKLSKNLSISRIVHGHMRLANWEYSDSELETFIDKLLEIGVTTFDHADIYGNYNCEKIFGRILKNNTALRNKLQIITKCGIKLLSDNFPERKIKYYDYSYEYIINSVETSLRNFNTDRIDLFLLHRPAPFFNPEEVAKAFSYLHQTGKVIEFGVSNFLPRQMEMLQSYTDQKLVTNQIEISPAHIEHVKNGNIDFLLKEKIVPMAWSPTNGGNISLKKCEKTIRLHKVLTEIAQVHNIISTDSIIFAWLLMHPAGIIPIVGSRKFARISEAVYAQQLKLTTEQWYRIYVASTGVDVL